MPRAWRRPPAACAASGRPCTPEAPDSGRSQTSVYRPAMPPRRVIGIDAGGTKLLGGRGRRGSRGPPQGPPDLAGSGSRGDARHLRRGGRGGARGRAGRGGGRRSASPRWWSRDRRIALVEAPAARRRALPRRDERATRAAGGGRQRRERALLAEARFGAARASRTRSWSRSAPGSAAGCCSTAGLPGRARAGRGDRAHGGRPPRPGLPGRLPRARVPRGDGLGFDDRARGPAAAAAHPESALGRRLAAEQEITGGIVTELAHAGDAAAARSSPRSGAGSATGWSAW